MEKSWIQSMISKIYLDEHEVFIKFIHQNANNEDVIQCSFIKYKNVKFF